MVFAIGIGVPFLLIGLLFKRMARTMDFLKRNGRRLQLAGGSMLVLLCCLTVVAIGWWQRERIPLLSSLLGQPTATSTPRPTRPSPTASSRARRSSTE